MLAHTVFSIALPTTWVGKPHGRGQLLARDRFTPHGNQSVVLLLLDGHFADATETQWIGV